MNAQHGIMKLVKFGDFDRVGAIINEQIVDLNFAYSAYLANTGGEKRPYALASLKVPADMLSFLEGGWESLQAASEAVRYVVEECSTKELKGPRGEKLVYQKNGVRLRTPYASLKNKTISIGRNFPLHMLEGIGTRFEKYVAHAQQMIRPAGFLKLASSVIGPDDEIIYPKKTKELDYEVELAAIIGKKGKDIPADKAEEYIVGYTVFNDVSARDQPDREDWNFFYLQKNFDTSSPVGPCITTKDEIGDPYNLTMMTRVNGEIRQNGNSRDMIRKFPEFIEYFSRDITLYPGDIFTGGTCEGVGLGHRDASGKPDTTWFLKPGDTVEAEIEKIGVLRNYVVAPK
ncbi:MAG: fumarylacetoacetate hydrolase family protein [Thaumarchaeota archaeon]|nr:fumarylacetoacetate hydrolase family protein [Nitrososphaerota archaeon]